MYLFYFFKGDLIPSSFFFSFSLFSFFKQSCVFLPSMRTVQLFCVLFSPCVHSRPSTVTYLIFVTVTKVITYSVDVYIYTAYYPKGVWKEGLSVLHTIVLGLFVFLIFFSVCLFLYFFLFMLFSLILALESKSVSLMWRNRCDKSM